MPTAARSCCSPGWRTLHPQPRRRFRAALLLEDASGLANPQTGPRLTLTGRIIPTPSRGYAASLPAIPAPPYADFGDFRFFRMEVDGGQWVGGFAQARRLERSLLLTDPRASQAIAEAEPSAIDHMHADHAEAIDLWASRLLGLAGSGWRIIAIDPEGCDLGCGEAAFARLAFPVPLPTPAAACAISSSP
ncbi:MAG: hypothetical protein U1E35_07925 [Rhodospirillales bacterium]